MDIVIRKTIIDDLVSRTPQDVLDAIADADEDLSDELGFMDATSKVPLFCYTSVSKLLMGVDSSAELPKLVSYLEGRGVDDAQHGISMMYASEEAAEVPGVQEIDEEPANEYALLKILCRMQDIPLDGSKDNLVAQLDRRIRFLIDSKCRARRAMANPAITPQINTAGIDINLNPDYGLVCHWLKYVTPSNARERASLYRVEFVTVMTP